VNVYVCECVRARARACVFVCVCVCVYVCVRFLESAIFRIYITRVNTCYTYQCVMLSYTNEHVTLTNESCYKYEQVTSHIWIRHVTHMNETRHIHKKKNWCHTKAYVTSQTWVSPVTHMNGTCHACEWFVLHERLSHAAHRNVSSHALYFFLKANGRSLHGTCHVYK